MKMMLNNIVIGSGDGLPIGTIVGFSGTTPPLGWLLCDGGAISKTTYASLYNILGDKYTPLSSLYTVNTTLTGKTATLNEVNLTATLDANGDYAKVYGSLEESIRSAVAEDAMLISNEWECIIPCYIHTIKGTNSCFFYGSDSSHCSILVCFDSSTLKVWMSSTYGTSWNVLNGKAFTVVKVEAFPFSTFQEVP